MINTVLPLLKAAASNYFDEFFAQNLLSKKCILVRLLFEGGFYSRAASNNGNTVSRYIWFTSAHQLAESSEFEKLRQQILSCFLTNLTWTITSELAISEFTFE